MCGVLTQPLMRRLDLLEWDLVQPGPAAFDHSDAAHSDNLSVARSDRYGTFRAVHISSQRQHGFWESLR
jgi:hypothetical protein